MDEITYQLDRLVEVAGQVNANAEDALLENISARSQAEFDTILLPWFMFDPLTSLIDHYHSRLNASYQWQMDVAQALIKGASQMGETDNVKAQGFIEQG